MYINLCGNLCFKTIYIRRLHTHIHCTCMYIHTYVHTFTVCTYVCCCLEAACTVSNLSQLSNLYWWYCCPPHVMTHAIISYRGVGSGIHSPYSTDHCRLYLLNHSLPALSKTRVTCRFVLQIQKRHTPPLEALVKEQTYASSKTFISSHTYIRTYVYTYIELVIQQVKKIWA